MDNRWIAVDLDGTLAFHGEWKGPEHIGEPLMPMVNRIKEWLSEGRKVKIFTARAQNPDNIPIVQEWLVKHGLPRLDVTNIKDYAMTELWDDRCIQVQRNIGEPVLN